MPYVRQEYPLSGKRSYSVGRKGSAKKKKYDTHFTPLSFFRRKTPLYRSVVQGPNTVHKLVKSCHLTMRAGSLGYSFNVGTSWSTTFSLWMTNQDIYIWKDAVNYSTVPIPGYSEIAALFDEVMIDKVVMTLYTTTDPHLGSTTNAVGSATIMLATDYNDKVAPVSVTDVQQYSDCKSWQCIADKPQGHVLYPRFLTFTADAVSQTPIATTPRRGYVRSNANQEHFGLKGGFLANGPDYQAHIYTFKVYFNCRVAK